MIFSFDWKHQYEYQKMIISQALRKKLANRKKQGCISTKDSIELETEKSLHRDKGYDKDLLLKYFSLIKF